MLRMVLLSVFLCGFNGPISPLKLFEFLRLRDRPFQDQGVTFSHREKGFQDSQNLYWDNSITPIKNGRKFLRFALSTQRFPGIGAGNPPTQKQIEERDSKAIRMVSFTSDDLQHWSPSGESIGPSSDADDFDSHALWSGSAIEKDEVVYLFYTGVSKKDQLAGRDKLQRIGMAKLVDGSWHKMGVVLDPFSPEVKKLGYDPNGTEFAAMAWRDPAVFEHDGIFYIYFAARRIDEQGRSVPAVGVAHSTDPELTNWVLDPPLEIEAEPNEEIELPNVVSIEGKDHLLMYTSKSFGENETAARIKLFLHYPSTSEISDINDLLLKPELDPEVYGAHLFRVGKKMFATGFCTEYFTLSPVLPVGLRKGWLDLPFASLCPITKGATSAVAP